MAEPQKTRYPPNKQNKDRLSNLPKEVIDTILSYLDTKNLIQTSLLSKSWRSIWYSHPFFNFTLDTYDDPYIRWKSIKTLIQKFLLFRNSTSIQAFRFTCSYSYGLTSLFNYYLPLWIEVALRREVQEIGLEFTSDNETLELPNEVFNCKTLRILKLKRIERDKGPWIFDTPRQLKLVNLKVLHLRSLWFRGSEFMENLFSGCPVLETLILIDCSLPETNEVTLSSTQLKHLVIHWLYKLTSDSWDSEYKIRVSAPNLKTFTCRSEISVDYDTSNLLSLDKADMHLVLYYDNYSDTSDSIALPKVLKKGYAKKMMRILEGFHRAKSLVLPALMLEVFPVPPAVVIPPFDALRELKLNIFLSKFGINIFFTKNCIRSMSYLLGISRNVEILHIEITRLSVGSVAGERYGTKDLMKWSYGERDKQSKREFLHLKFIEIRYIKESPSELQLIEMLLRRAVSLENIMVFTLTEDKSDTKWFSKFRKEMTCMFPRVEIVFL